MKKQIMKVTLDEINYGESYTDVFITRRWKDEQGRWNTKVKFYRTSSKNGRLVNKALEGRIVRRSSEITLSPEFISR